MCRIFGIIYGDGIDAEQERLSAGQIARIMGQELVHGGPHAFGWMQNVGGNVDVRKFSGRIDEQLEKLYSIKRECKWLVGHVRYATHGDSENLNNVHPIRHDNIVGVHNGVLTNHESVLKECGGRMNDQTEVDSEAIFAAVEHFGHQKGLAKLYGSMVAVYTDLRKPDSLYIARSNSRALRLGWTMRGNLIFASEQSALDALVKAGIEFDSFSGVSENRVLRLKNGDIKDRITYRPVPSQFPARASSVPTVADMALDEATAVMAAYINRSASKRGEILFPSGRRRIPSERLDDYMRHSVTANPYDENGKPDKKPKKRQKVNEVCHVVGEGKVKYKGQYMTQDEYLALRASELADAIVAPEEDWTD